MSAIFHSDYLLSFGFHTESNSTLIKRTEITKDEGIKILNGVNILSWIPIIGGIIGAIRIDVVRRHSNGFSNLDSFDKAILVRGILEVGTLGCVGPLLAIVDLVVTVGRSCLPFPEENSLI